MELQQKLGLRAAGDRDWARVPSPLEDSSTKVKGWTHAVLAWWFPGSDHPASKPSSATKDKCDPGPIP
jgi:hypothetical protein